MVICAVLVLLGATASWLVVMVAGVVVLVVVAAVVAMQVV